MIASRAVQTLRIQSARYDAEWALLPAAIEDGMTDLVVVIGIPQAVQSKDSGPEDPVLISPQRGGVLP